VTSAGTTREVIVPELRVVAVSSDGARLVLKAADATEYTLPIDERLRAAVRGDRPRLGQIDVESHLRPRDIQARIRAGATAEEVAQLAGIAVERVRRFEGPVLAERAFMAERARKTAIRRQGESTGPQLGDAVAERLLLRGAEKDSAAWDSWRRDDGTWEVVLGFRADGRTFRACWTYDPPRRLVQANDDEARALIGEGPERGPAEEPTYPFVPRIARLPRERDGRDGRETDGRDGRPVEDIGGIDETPAGPPAAGAGGAVAASSDALTSLLDSMPGFRGGRPERVERVDRIERSAPGVGGGEAGGAGGTEEPSTAAPRVPDPEPETEVPPAAAASAGAGAAYADILMPRSVNPHRDRLVGTTDRQAEADGVRPGRRATVPTWDEIVFGSRRKKKD
jgi:hypothetical protein